MLNVNTDWKLLKCVLREIMAHNFILIVTHVEGTDSFCHSRDDVTSDTQLPEIKLVQLC